MNPMSIIQTIMGQMKTKAPNNFDLVNNLMQNNGNPQSILQQIMSNTTPEQKQNLLKQAEGYGCPKNILSQIQNMK